MSPKFKPPAPRRGPGWYLKQRKYTLYPALVVFGAGLVGFLVYMNITANLGHDPSLFSNVMTGYAIQLDRYRADHGRYPTTDAGLALLTTTRAPDGAPYLVTLPPDPAGQPFQYESDGAQYILATVIGRKRVWIASTDGVRAERDIFRLITARLNAPER